MGAGPSPDEVCANLTAEVNESPAGQQRSAGQCGWAFQPGEDPSIGPNAPQMAAVLIQHAINRVLVDHRLEIISVAVAVPEMGIESPLMAIDRWNKQVEAPPTSGGLRTERSHGVPRVDVSGVIQ
jgi:hypothetical protein